MIVVLDSNVIISALLSPGGAPAQIINRWEADAFRVVASAPLLAELQQALKYPRVAKHLKLSDKALSALIGHFAIAAAIVEPRNTLEIVEDDPNDNRVLECAAAGGAAYIVTGDNHLLELKEYRGIVILPPFSFLALLELDE